MKTLKRIFAAGAVTLFLAIAAFADCEPPVPGQTQTPPCSTAQPATDDSTVPGQLETPPASDSVDLVTVAEDAITTLLLFTIS
jgi:hypothetical protein